MNALATAWFSQNRSYFKPQHAALIQSKLENMDDAKVAALSTIRLKNPVLLLVVEIFLGELGVHRFMLGQIGMGIIELLTFGFFGILWFVDLFTVMGNTKEYNYNLVLPLL